MFCLVDDSKEVIMMSQKNSEKGQALIFIVIGFVILLGFVGLAIDGGRVYSDRRHAQNSSDAASLAGGAAAALNMENSRLFYTDFDCGNDDGRLSTAIKAAKDAAIARAASNGFTIDTDVSDYHGVTVICGVDTSSGFADKYMDVTVDLTTVTHAYFAQFFSNGELQSEVTAVTRVRPRIPFAFGHAIVALGKQDCSGNQYGTIFGGSSKVHIVGGGVFSNGCMNGNGAKFEVNVENGTIYYAGQLDAGNGDWIVDDKNTTPQKASSPLPEWVTSISPPNCAGPNAHSVTTLTESDFPLKYDGLICVTGSADIKINGGDIRVDCNASGATCENEGRVTFYFAEANVEINGGKAQVNLMAPYSADTGVPGMLFYLAKGNLEITGNNTSVFEGTVFVPNGEIKAHGTAGMTSKLNTQLIGKHVDVSGNYDLDIVFNQGTAAQIPTGIELNR
jgi:hypothetical protein